MPIDDRLVHQRPEPLGGLELRTVGWQEDEADSVRNGQALGAMPARVVEHEDDAALATRAGLAREGGEQFGEEGLREAAAEVPDRLAAGRLHKGSNVQPLVAVVAECDRALTHRCPDPAPDWLQAKAVLILGPDLDRSVWMCGGCLGDCRGQVFFSVSRSSDVAARGWRGRGVWTDHSSRFSASQPRWGCTFASPRCRAIQAATLGPLHNPPSSGGSRNRSAKAASRSGVSRLALRPFRRRRSPMAACRVTRRLIHRRGVLGSVPRAIAGAPAAPSTPPAVYRREVGPP